MKVLKLNTYANTSVHNQYIFIIPDEDNLIHLVEDFLKDKDINKENMDADDINYIPKFTKYEINSIRTALSRNGLCDKFAKFLIDKGYTELNDATISMDVTIY